MIPQQDRAAHERLLLELSEQEFQQWRHNPITAAYLRYLGDLTETFRTSAADLLEAGTLAPQSDVIRGRLLTLRELHLLSLEDIHNFYRQEEKVEDDGAKTN